VGASTVIGDVLRWPEDGLIPVVAQDDATGDVLMVAFMNREALERTRETGIVHYWSRSRNALWLKGESSGNVQRVADIRVNCDRNSLLLRVRQQGAVCHDGYPTCYYRRIGEDGALETIRERAFDPGTVYGRGENPLTAPARLLVDAYHWLADHELEAVSGTSRRLRAAEDDVSRRVHDELGELEDALAGEHLHGTPRETVLLESTQCLYWLTLAAIRAGERWETYRPDLGLSAPDASRAVERVAAARARWAADAAPDPDRWGTTLQAIASACAATRIDPLEILEADLADLRGRPYLAGFFAGGDER